MSDKIELQYGENYRCRDGEEIGPLTETNGRYRSTHPFRSEKLGRTFRLDGGYELGSGESMLDIIAHIPKPDSKPTPPPKPTKTQREIAAAEKRLADLRELDRIERDILAKRGEMDVLKAGKAALVAKIYGSSSK